MGMGPGWRAAVVRSSGWRALYLLPMDRRLLPLSFRLLPVDARRKVTLQGSDEGSGALLGSPDPHSAQPCTKALGISGPHPRSRNFRRVFLSSPIVGLAGSGGLASRLSSFMGRGRKGKLPGWWLHQLCDSRQVASPRWACFTAHIGIVTPVCFVGLHGLFRKTLHKPQST